MTQKEAVYESYESWSKSYDEQENPTRDVSTAVIKKLIRPIENQIIVEAGCGTGINTQWLAPQCKTVIGLDFSESMLALAKQKVQADNVQFFVQDLYEQWPVDAETVDLVLIALVLEHIDNIETVLNQAHRILKSGAYLMITEYHPDRVKRGSGAEFNNGDDAPTEIINFHHPLEEYEQVAKTLGFRLDEVLTWRKELAENGDPVETSRDPLLLTLIMSKN